jgi:4-hydroxy-tetrahydrodipicolinate reductase
MEHLRVLISGMPGKVCLILARGFISDERFSLLPTSLTGPGVPEEALKVNGTSIALAGPDRHREVLLDFKDRYGNFIVVDYSHPEAVNRNAGLYCELDLGFVMGTTGGDRAELARTVEASHTSAVIAPNMAKPIVGFTAMMEYMAKTFPGIFAGYDLSIRESHQAGKADTSGTARAMVGYFNRMGVGFSED